MDIITSLSCDQNVYKGDLKVMAFVNIIRLRMLQCFFCSMLCNLPKIKLARKYLNRT